MNANFDNHDAMQSSNSAPPERDRFELLSAYLDGEVTAAERRQVEALLERDPKFAHMHRRLMTLRQGFQTLPVPESAQPVERMINQVLDKVERRSRLRLILGGALAAAAASVAIIGGMNTQSYAPQIAASSKSGLESEGIPKATSAEASFADGLNVQLDQPLLVIAKTTDEAPSVNNLGNSSKPNRQVDQ
ncbi:MAG: Fis family transcriptional regulator [Alkalinema sp. RU_4_3]|nr:Fis family transcriptional regulator [Alkalinema sp. RU_4_3]